MKGILICFGFCVISFWFGFLIGHIKGRKETLILNDHWVRFLSSSMEHYNKIFTQLGANVKYLAESEADIYKLFKAMASEINDEIKEEMK